MWPNYMEANGYSKTTISSLWSLAALIEMPAMWLGGALSDITGRAVVLAAGGLFIATVQIGYMLFVASLPLLLGVQVVRGFGFGGYTSAAMTFAAEHGGKARGNSGLFNTARCCGESTGRNAGAGGGLQCALSRLCGAGSQQLRHAAAAPDCRCSSWRTCRADGAMAHVASTSMWPNYMATFGYSKTAISSLWSLAAFIELPAMYIKLARD